MSRTNPIRVWLLAAFIAAFGAIPAMASGGHQSVNAITGGSSHPSRTGDAPGRSSPNSIVGAGNESRALIAVSGQPDRLPGPRSEVVSGHGYGAPTSHSAPDAVVQSTPADGFDWRDALVGALVATALMLLAAGAVRLASRARGRTARSSV
jgi:hypothetical protein